MPFLDNLRRNNTAPIGPANYPSGGSGGIELGTAATASGGNSLNDILGTITPFINNMRSRDLADLRSQLQIQSEFSGPGMQGSRIRNIADPNTQPEQNVVLANPGITDFQKEGLNLDRQRLGLDKSKAKTAERVGDEKLDLQNENLKLDKLKNQQIYQTKIDELERRTEESEAKMKLAYDTLQAKGITAQGQLELHQAQIEAQNARHALDMARKDEELANTTRMTDARIEQIRKAMEDSGYTMQEETASEPDASGIPTKKVTITKKGAAAKTTVSDKKNDPLSLRK